MSIPNFENKSKNWETFIKNEQKFSTDYNRYGMNGFFWQNQDKLLTSFIDPFFDNLSKIYKNKDMHYSSAFGNTLFPSIFDPKMILNKTESFLDNNNGLPKLCKKGLIENCDHLKRRVPILEKQ